MATMSRRTFTRVESFQNIVVANTWQQYATHGDFIQRGGGSSATLSPYLGTDNVFLISGFRGVANCDRETTVRRTLMAWPPTAGPITWSGNPEFWSELDRNPSGTPTILDTVLAAKINDNANWGNLPTAPDILADPRASTGNAGAYDAVFPNMAANGYLSWDSGNGQWRITPPTSGQMPRTRDGVRAWISDNYTPFHSRKWPGLGG